MLSSWVEGADGSGFPVEHLPFGVFSAGGGEPRLGVRIGDRVLDLARLASDGLVGVGPAGGGVFASGTLNPFLALGPDAWLSVRGRLTELLCDPAAEARVAPALVPLADATVRLPIAVADYVDFYSSIEHATNLGRMFRPDAEPLLPNWRHLPVAYHGRAGTVVVSGTPVTRPEGQRRSPEGPIVFGPSTRLDIELELGFVVGVPSRQGHPIAVAQAADHVFGVVLVNDWSARDIQVWEGQPLGPFLGKSFATTMSAWVTPLAALAGSRVEGPVQDPEPLEYLRLAEPWGLDVDLEVGLAPSGGATAPVTISRGTAAGLYWRMPQQIAHLTANGAHLRTGDLLASGTISGPERGSEGSLIELTRNGAEPLDIAGTQRTFLEDGDEVVLRGRARPVEGVTLELGDATGRIVAAGPVESR
ncbi:MAG TPA: fumarylacetoacetase [Acidimicrobiales bacterium]|nr:fumarylacetoacetase [Acidimicrobiales bacterium]